MNERIEIDMDEFPGFASASAPIICEPCEIQYEPEQEPEQDPDQNSTQASANAQVTREPCESQDLSMCKTCKGCGFIHNSPMRNLINSQTPILN